MAKTVAPSLCERQPRNRESASTEIGRHEVQWRSDCHVGWAPHITI